MTEPREPMSLPSVEQWRGEFMRAAVAHEEKRRATPRWRRWFVPFIVVAVLVGGGYATAKILDFVTTDPVLPPFKGELHAYVDLDTGAPIRCPDGSLLINDPEHGRYAIYPKCPDGSVPDEYKRMMKRLKDWLAVDHPANAEHPLGPRFEFQPALDEDGNPLPEQAPQPNELRRPGQK